MKSSRLHCVLCVLVTCMAPGRVASADPPPYAPGPMLARFLAGPLVGVEEIVFAVRISGRDHGCVNFGNYSCDHDLVKERGFKFEDGVYWGYGDGGRLCRLNLRTGAMKTLLDDPKGGVRDPQLHYDGRKILFSYRKGGQHAYHLCEIDVDGGAMRQLTDGPYDDIEPTYLPEGSIVFCSSRCRRFVNCGFSRVATLYRCDGDGKSIRMLSCNNDHDNTPWMLPDGRVLYMRWEYVGRGQLHFHYLWTMNPDGTNQTVFFGNEMGSIAMFDAKPIPSTGKVVVSYSWGHGLSEHHGSVAVVDPTRGPDIPSSACIVSKTADYRDPYAMSEGCFLVADLQGLAVMDGQGNTETFYRLPESDHGLECHEPRPVAARPREPVIPSRVDLSKTTGRAVLQNVYAGRNMAGVKPGEIKKLLVLQQLPKPVNFSGGMEPMTIDGGFALAEVLGTVPVEPDGSAYMELPALRSLFFIALDEDDMSVKRMQSFMTVQPGETIGCVGCHEHRAQAPALRPALAALRKPPHSIERIADVPNVLDFPRDVQPMLDRHCVQCHNPDRYEGRVDLTGDKTGRYTMSYQTIHDRNLVVDGRNSESSNRPPGSIGSSASRLMKLIDGTHYGVKVSPQENRIVRLWIEVGATYPGTYAALGCGMYHVWLGWPEAKHRCMACHGREVNDRWGRRYVNFFHGGTDEDAQSLANLSRPEKSLVLRAPLAKEAGGLGLCKKAVFTSENDPIYQKMLASIRMVTEQLQKEKRFDMPGFHPNRHYIREMQRFGILPANLNPDHPIDPYLVDRTYWNSFNYCPAPANR